MIGSLLFGMTLIVCSIFIITYFISTTRHEIYNRPITRNLRDIPFPEHIYDGNRPPDYRERVQAGFSHMENNGVIFAGLVHNLQDIIELSIQRLVFIGKYFEHYRIVLYENNSTDATKKILARLEDNNPCISVISEDIANTKSSISYGAHNLQRFKRMGEYRNKYLNHIRENIDCSKYQYIAVVDMDLLLGCSLEGMAHSFSFTDWDAIGCNGLDAITGLYYDPLAFRDNDGWRVTGHCPVPNVSHRYHPKTIPNEGKLLPVQSCFAGIVLYQTGALLSGTYGGYDCEHICLHDSMKEQGFTRMFINSQFIVIR